MSMIDSKVINVDELKLEHFAKGATFECGAVRMGLLLGAFGGGLRHMTCNEHALDYWVDEV